MRHNIDHIRATEYPIDPLFRDRWSPRAMSGAPITLEDLMSLFEAARWAPSSYNSQPWRFLYAMRDSVYWPVFFDLLTETNKTWAKNAAVLTVIVSMTTFNNGKPSVTHCYSTGAAWQNFALQGWLKGYVVHGMQGFDYDKARETLHVPDEYQVLAMAAVGMPGNAGNLPPALQEKERPSPRKKLAEIVFEGPFVLH